VFFVFLFFGAQTLFQIAHIALQAICVDDPASAVPTLAGLPKKIIIGLATAAVVFRGTLATLPSYTPLWRKSSSCSHIKIIKPVYLPQSLPSTLSSAAQSSPLNYPSD
jgi:hypothetical protein